MRLTFPIFLCLFLSGLFGCSIIEQPSTVTITAKINVRVTMGVHNFYDPCGTADLEIVAPSSLAGQKIHNITITDLRDISLPDGVLSDQTIKFELPSSLVGNSSNEIKIGNFKELKNVRIENMGVGNRKLSSQ